VLARVSVSELTVLADTACGHFRFYGASNLLEGVHAVVIVQFNVGHNVKQVAVEVRDFAFESVLWYITHLLFSPVVPGVCCNGSAGDLVL